MLDVEVRDVVGVELEVIDAPAVPEDVGEFVRVGEYVGVRVRESVLVLHERSAGGGGGG